MNSYAMKISPQLSWMDLAPIYGIFTTGKSFIFQITIFMYKLSMELRKITPDTKIWCSLTKVMATRPESAMSHVKKKENEKLRLMVWLVMGAAWDDSDDRARHVRSVRNIWTAYSFSDKVLLIKRLKVLYPNGKMIVNFFYICRHWKHQCR